MAFSRKFVIISFFLYILYQPMYPRHEKYIIKQKGFNSATNRFTQNDERNFLPASLITFSKDPDKLDCNGFYLLAEERDTFTFKLNSPDQACKYTFAGSIMEECTAAIMCTGKLNYSGNSTSCSNNIDYFEVSDASGGKEKLCGSSNFDEIPKVARNNGTDLFVTYKASSKSAVCIVFCVEDVTRRDEDILQKLQPLRNRKRRKTEEECVCGQLNLEGRVVHGENAGKFMFPWIAPIVPKIPTGNSRKPFCAASLINDRYAVTAAHCFKMQSWSRKAGEIQLIFHSHVMDRNHRRFENPNDERFKIIPGWNSPKETDGSERSIRANVEKIILHPKYNYEKTGLDFDMALLKLKGRIKLKANKVLPVCLPEVGDRFVDFTGKNMTVAGWGYVGENIDYTARILQKLDMQFAVRDECIRTDKPAGRHICAGYVEGGMDACQGDSGGPLITQLDGGYNQYHLAGVVSGGIGCARRDHYGLYTNVQELVQWVYHTTQDGIYCKKVDDDLLHE